MLSRDTKEHDIPVGKRPWKIAIDTSATNHRVYVANQFNSSVSVINPNTNMRELDIRVGSYPLDIAISHFGKIYVANTGSEIYKISNNIMIARV
jgi:YVTN family beta-propeller protein